MACLLEASEEGPGDSNGDLRPPDRFPPEPQSGPMEYKLHLADPNQSRLEHLTTQMKWRMEEGGGEAIYRVGVTDSGAIKGLDHEETVKSLETMYKMAQKVEASVSVVRRYRCAGKKVVLELRVRTVDNSSQCTHYMEPSVAILGPIDAGKSTLLGVLTDGQMDNGRGQARLNLLRHRHELLSGRTSSINHGFVGFDKHGRVVNYETCESIQEICRTSSKVVTLIDLAGHQKYLKTTVFGLTAYQPELAMLVVGANTEIDQTTCDQVWFSMALHMPLFVVVTKVDICDESQLVQTTQGIVQGLLEKNDKKSMTVECERDVHTAAQTIREGKIVPIFHISCVTGHHLDLLKRFLNMLPVQSSRQKLELLSQEPAEFHVDELFNVHEVGLVLGGILKRGVMKEGDVMKIGPLQDGSFRSTRVRSIRFRISRTACIQIYAGQAATITVSDVERSDVRKGTVLLSDATLDSSANSCREFEADLVLLHSSNSCVKKGFQSTIYVASIMQNAIIVSIKEKDSLSTGDSGLVHFRFLCHPEFLRVGSRVVLREGPTKATGEVSRLFPLEPVS